MTFDDAIEKASCYFGLNAGTSCIGAVYETKHDWVFWSAGCPQLGYAAVSVSKESGQLSTLKHQSRMIFAPRNSNAIEVPRKYENSTVKRIAKHASGE